MQEIEPGLGVGGDTALPHQSGHEGTVHAVQPGHNGHELSPVDDGERLGFQPRQLPRRRWQTGIPLQLDPEARLQPQVVGLGYGHDGGPSRGILYHGQRVAVAPEEAAVDGRAHHIGLDVEAHLV